jgi:signal transduction histidine kinase/CheY-like chemotaxis protein
VNKTPMPTSSDARAAPAAIERQIEFERVSTLYAVAPPTLIGGIAYALLVGMMLWSLVPQPVLVAWVGFKVVLGMLRLVDGRVFARQRHRGLRMAHWKNRFFAGSLLDACSWGLMTVLFLPTPDPAINGVMIAGLVGVASAGVLALAAHRVASGASLALVLGPLVELQAFSPTGLERFTAATLFVYGAVLFVEAQNSHRRFSETMRLRFENAAIAEERHRALVYAEHSNAAKTRFLASVSHELRTPLNGIIGMTQLVAVEPLSPLQRQRMEVLRHSAEHLVTVIGDLLDLSRIEFDRIELNPQPALLAQTVRDVTDLLQPVAEERGLAFEVVFDLGLPAAALIDTSRVKQVLHNLIGNALKFTAAGEVGLWVGMSDGLLRFRVTDTGEGIPAESIDRIFDAFEQGPSTTAPARSGAGLGLTISRRLARAMGGDVTCRSAPGKGTTFEFTIAFRPTPRTPSPRPSATAEISAAAVPRRPADLRPGHVLVVEDNEVNALVVRGMLEQMGVHAELAVNGQKALAAMRQSAFDLVLMDCQMPVVDGWEATRIWRAHEARTRAERRTPIVALTASAAAGERERCLDAGMDDYLSKPFTREALGAVIDRYLPASTPAQAGATSAASGPEPEADVNVNARMDMGTNTNTGTGTGIDTHPQVNTNTKSNTDVDANGDAPRAPATDA